MRTEVNVITGEVTELPDAEVTPYVPTPAELNAPIVAQLDEIDAKKIRALSDAILTGDNLRLQQLEAQAADLRAQLVK